MNLTSLSVHQANDTTLTIEHNEQKKAILFLGVCIVIGLILSFLFYLAFQDISLSSIFIVLTTGIGLAGLLFAKKSMYIIDSKTNKIFLSKKSAISSYKETIDLHFLQKIQLVTFNIKNALGDKKPASPGQYGIYLQYSHKSTLLFRESDYLNMKHIVDTLGAFLKKPVEDLEKDDWIISSKWNIFKR